MIIDEEAVDKDLEQSLRVFQDYCYYYKLHNCPIGETFEAV